VAEYVGNITLASLELDGDGSALCRLAAASVRERNMAKLDAQMQMSALANALFSLRDNVRFDLGLFSTSQTFDFWVARKRSQMLLEEQYRVEPPSEDDVCLRVTNSSTLTSAEFDAYAADMEGMHLGYARETAIMYSGLIIAVVLFARWVDAWGAFAAKYIGVHWRHHCSLVSLKRHPDKGLPDRLLEFLKIRQYASEPVNIQSVSLKKPSAAAPSLAEPAAYRWKPMLSPRDCSKGDFSKQSLEALDDKTSYYQQISYYQRVDSRLGSYIKNWLNQEKESEGTDL
jgi:hypothetical protein